MGSISPGKLATDLLEACLGGAAEPAGALDTLLDWAVCEDEGLAGAASQALFGTLAEGLADRFEPALCSAYASLFSRVLARVLPGWDPASLRRRYDEVRAVRPVEGDPEDVYVLSRVTLGADVAVTSIVLDGARRRFPTSNLWLAGPAKSWELFERSLRLRHLPVEYGRRGSLSSRVSVYGSLQEVLGRETAIVLDPDSRLSQLGLLPICDASRHFLFESRAFGGGSDAALPELARQWVNLTLGVPDAEPWLHPKFEYDFSRESVITVNLGVGENPSKRVEDPFEEELLKMLAATGATVMVDVGAPGSEEESRVRRAMDKAGECGGVLAEHRGPFASFAAMIAASRLYVGYDSAGQHVAAALGVPLISVFAGYPSLRMMQRWSPRGHGPGAIIPVKPGESWKVTLAEVGAAVQRLFAGDPC